MADAPIGIVRALFRFFRFWNWRKARGIIDAADQQFTGSVDGISAAFDMHQDQVVQQFRGLRDAVAEVEAVLEDKRSRLAKLNDEEHDLLRKREGALALAEQTEGRIKRSTTSTPPPSSASRPASRRSSRCNSGSKPRSARPPRP